MAQRRLNSPPSDTQTVARLLLGGRGRLLLGCRLLLGRSRGLFGLGSRCLLLGRLLLGSWGGRSLRGALFDSLRASGGNHDDQSTKFSKDDGTAKRNNGNVVRQGDSNSTPTR